VRSLPSLQIHSLSFPFSLRCLAGQSIEKGDGRSHPLFSFCFMIP
jgi:hypothetical protein